MSKLEGITVLHTQWNLFQAPWHIDKSEITFERLREKKKRVLIVLGF